MLKSQQMNLFGMSQQVAHDWPKFGAEMLRLAVNPLQAMDAGS